eukprot:3724370-Amphidinium_carterae.1
MPCQSTNIKLSTSPADTPAISMAVRGGHFPRTLARRDAWWAVAEHLAIPRGSARPRAPPMRQLDVQVCQHHACARLSKKVAQDAPLQMLMSHPSHSATRKIGSVGEHRLFKVPNETASGRSSTRPTSRRIAA